MSDSPAVNLVDQAIRNRKTLKVLAEKQYPFALADEVVETLLESASWAPFHLPAAKEHCESELTSKVPLA